MSSTTIDPINFEMLEKECYVSLREIPNPQYRVVLSELLDKEKMQQFSAFYGPHIEALSPEVIASFFGSWYGCVSAVLQYGMSHHDRVPVLSLSNIEVQVYEDHGHSMFNFMLIEHKEEACPNPLDAQARSEWRAQVLDTFYKKEAKPLVDMFAESTGLNAGQIWTRMADSLNYYYELWHGRASSLELKQKLEADMEALKETEPETFGRSKNPFILRFRYVEDWHDAGKQLRMKSVCCLAYKTKDHGYCYTCPRMSKEERVAKKQALLERHVHGHDHDHEH
ncbi:(2Fe-2S)-binding protein [Paenibacillus sp. 481]|uniref:(2Fe-2S)-binding protein n=1 Tax=Paenibacillus sp. 481 TaxID=2835869 RepID=UPI001E631EE4|nr:(2Fe-2S)-binding protein [Paenibacillus sp. 481]UHA75537.1 (2Fe-2S)-binding protein [Paenibacillus sp. 481]